MNDDLLRTFDTLPKADLSEIDDANDNVPLTHKGGTVDQTDLRITPNSLNCITVLRCDTAANVAKKECTYVGGMPLNGAAEECIGRTIMVIFTNENSVDNPFLSYNKLSGPIVLLNQATGVTVGKNCFGKNTRELFTWDGTAFVMHSNIASNDNASTGLTRFSDGTDVYNKQSVDNQINGALTNKANVKYVNDVTNLLTEKNNSNARFHMANSDNTAYVKVDGYDFIAHNNDQSYTEIIGLRDLYQKTKVQTKIVEGNSGSLGQAHLFTATEGAKVIVLNAQSLDSRSHGYTFQWNDGGWWMQLVDNQVIGSGFSVLKNFKYKIEVKYIQVG